MVFVAKKVFVCVSEINKPVLFLHLAATCVTASEMISKLSGLHWSFIFLDGIVTILIVVFLLVLFLFVLVTQGRSCHMFDLY